MKWPRWLKRLGIIALYFVVFYWFFILVCEYGYQWGFEDGVGIVRHNVQEHSE